MDPPQAAGQRGRTRGSNRRCLDRGARAVEESAGDRAHGIDKGAGAIQKGLAERDRTLRERKDTVTMASTEKGPSVDKGFGKSECRGRYLYDAELDEYKLDPIGTKEKKPYILPGTIFRELFQHQKEGVEWLWGIHCKYPGCIVADDMGLGKTFQAAAFLSGLIHSELIKRVIIIVPLSVLDQWPEELKKAEIEHLVHIYHNCDDTVLKTVLKNQGIILTTYDTYVSKCKKLMGSSKTCWDYAVLDEAHRIKNIGSQTTGLVNTIHSKHKILLTGTPIQKDLMDLYSLLKFINPCLLGDAASFRKNNVQPINHGKYANVSENQKSGYKKAIEDVRTLTSIYMLRRDKRVLIESGQLTCKKHDMVVWLRLSELQMELYLKCEDIYSTRTGVRRESAIQKSTIWQAICNSPAALLNIQGNDSKEVTIHGSLKNELVDSFDLGMLSDNGNSCKATFIFDLIEDIFEEERKEKEDRKENEKDEEKKSNVRKILIFSRSLIMLDIIEEGLSYIVNDDQIARIDGSVQKDRRVELIKRFKSNDGPKILLLSAKVGGEGLNLTAATRLIIVDPSWNSSDDSQISDRIYRMGQKKDVYIYRLVTCCTIEEHTYKTQLLKGALGRGITEGMISASSVHKKEGKVLSLPDQKVRFDTSETFHRLECRKANKLEFDGPHLEFLTSHPLVYGVTNQNFVLSNDETPLSDFPNESSDRWSDFELNRKFQRPEPYLLKEMSSKLERKDAASKQQGDTVSYIDIPESKVGLIIGKDGQTIKRIRLSSSATVVVESPRFDRSSLQRSVQITGTIKAVEKAKQMIGDLIFEAEKMLPKAAESIQSGQKEEYLRVPDDMVGRIIGSQGRRVKDIRQKSGAFVQFVEEIRRFKLAGSQQQIDFAKGLIFKIIDKIDNELRETHEKYVAVPENMSNQFRARGSVDPRPGGKTATLTSGAIARSNGSERNHRPNRSEYYGERGPPNEQE